LGPVRNLGVARGAEVDGMGADGRAASSSAVVWWFDGSSLGESATALTVKVTMAYFVLLGFPLVLLDLLASLSLLVLHPFRVGLVLISRSSLYIMADSPMQDVHEADHSLPVLADTRPAQTFITPSLTSSGASAM
jgi:hypothetical protein